MKLKEELIRLIGSPEEVPLRRRIFHAANLFTCTTLAIVCILNLAQGAYYTSALVVAIGLAHGSFYYFSRIKGWYRLAKTGFILMCYLGVMANYFINDGIDGPSLLVFFFTFQLLISVSNFRFHIIHILITVGIVGALLFIEYYHPDWINSDYSSELMRVSNILIVFIVILLSFYWITHTLLVNYYQKQRESEKRAEQLKKQHDKLQKITEEKEKLFSLVFHDLKSPLSSIQLYLQAISNYGIKAETDQRLKINLLQLTKDTSAMLENVLEWISQQSDEIKPNLQQVDCNAAVAECIRIERPAADAKGIRFVTSLPLNNEVIADPMMLQMILRVLINNAIKFSKPDQKVTVSATRGSDSYLLSITDDGVGIPMEKQEKLFSPGINPARGTNNEKGSGLGLLLAKQYAEKQQTKVHFVSEPETGTTFTLIFRIHTNTPTFSD